jgi:glutamyl-tRNA reductase
MVHELVLLHRSGAERFDRAEQSSENACGWFSFKTCMRHIVITDEDSCEIFKSELRSTDQVYRGDDAYRFLLQVICGLHSPLIGETEVYGQFKNAVAQFALPATSVGGLLQRFFRALFEDAKRVRQAHLEDLGSPSYGSILRRELKGCARVRILGAGHLTQEILPWISKDGIEIRVHGRDPVKVRAELGALLKADQIHSLDDRADFDQAEALIVAAPVTAEWLKAWIGETRLSVVADLRSDSHQDILVAGSARVIALGELLERIAKNQTHLEARKRAALAAIDAAVAERSRHVEYRPFGWEDVCA